MFKLWYTYSLSVFLLGIFKDPRAAIKLQPDCRVKTTKVDKTSKRTLSSLSLNLEIREGATVLRNTDIKSDRVTISAAKSFADDRRTFHDKSSSSE